MAQVIVDTSTVEGRYLDRTLELLVFERIRPRSTLGLLWDVANLNLARQEAGEVFVTEIKVDTDPDVPDGQVAFLYSDGSCLFFDIDIKNYIDTKISQHFDNLDLLPNSELRT